MSSSRVSLHPLKHCKPPAAKQPPAGTSQDFLIQRIKQIRCGFEVRFACADNSGTCGLKRLFDRDALDPTLVRELFVIGKIETDDQTNLRGIGRRRIGLRSGLASGF